MRATLNDCPGGMTLRQEHLYRCYLSPDTGALSFCPWPQSHDRPLLRFREPHLCCAQHNVCHGSLNIHSASFLGIFGTGRSRFSFDNASKEGSTTRCPLNVKSGWERERHILGWQRLAADRQNSRPKGFSRSGISRTREKPRGDRRTNRRHPWLPASHLLQAWH